VRASETVPLRVLGVDGFGPRWLSVLVQAGESDGRLSLLAAEVFSDFAAVLAYADASGASVVAVDLPIGLPIGDQPGIRSREADAAAAQVLGPRGASLFPMPPQTILDLPWERANAEWKRLSGKGLSKQSHAMGPKIRDVAGHVGPGRRVVEVHP